MNMGEQETLITVALPEATRANSALGGLDNNVLADHQLRYILEIYSDGGNECLRNVKFAEGEKTEVVFNVRLVPGHAYDFVVWADFVKNGEDTYFDTKDGLDAIKMNNLDAMTEARDAYYNVVSIEAGEPVSKVNTITLTRPFAKVRVVADDVDEAKDALQNDLTKATVTYTDDVVVYNTFNARTQDVSVTGEVSKEKTFFYNTSAYDESNLYVDYLLIPQDGQSNVKFDLNVDGFVNRAFKTDIAVEANKLTTIKGNILTNGSDITVDVNDDFASETIYLEGDVTLTEDLVIDRPLVVRDDATAVLNLNNHNIIVKHDNGDTGVSEGIIVYGNLTIEGEGTVEANTRAVWARGDYGAKITINGGHYKGSKQNTEVIYASGNGQIEINGGRFEALTTSSGHGSGSNLGKEVIILNLHNNGAAGCSIVVKGGSFKNFNPADNVAENPKHNFCAEGYVSVANGEWFDVVKGATVASVEDFNAALANAEVEAVDVTNNVTFAEGLDINNRGEFTVNMGNNTLTSNDSFGYAGYIQNDTQVTFNNANIIGGGFQVAYGAELTFNDGSINVTTTQSGQRYCFYAYQSIITINGGTYSFNDLYKKRSYICASGQDAVVYVYGGTFGEAPKHPSWKYPIYEDGGAQVIIYGGTFGFDPSQWVADGYQAVQNGTTWTVSKE